MRRALLRQMPALTRFYGLLPSDIDRMTVREISEYQVQMDRAMAEAEAEQRRGR